MSGPYCRVRHPMYAVLFLLALVLMLMAVNKSIGLFWLGGLVAVVSRIDHEEAVMLEPFGDQYHNYMRRANRCLPKLAHQAVTISKTPARQSADRAPAQAAPFGSGRRA